MTHMIRHSQFIITWGPGSILEGPDGPRIIPMPDIGLFTRNSRLSPEDFAISDERMSKGLLDGNNIFRLPSNAELGAGNTPLYKTKAFPEWWVCTTHNRLYKKYKDGCPECKKGISGKRDAVRFVMACPKGHLDDVNWDYVVHLKSSGKCKQSYPKYYFWNGGGGSLKEIEITCPNCGSYVNLGNIYTREWNCSGRFPESENILPPPIRQRCKEKSQIIQRRATNLRIPEIATLFTIDNYTNLHRLLSMKEIKTLLIDRKPDNMEDLEKKLRKQVLSRNLNNGTVSEILASPWNEIKNAIDDIVRPSDALGYSELIKDEYRKLLHASINGAPPVKGASPISSVIFEVPKSKISKVKTSENNVFRITPITKLRTVLVQKGYRRISSDNHFVPTHFKDNKGSVWYPGVELLGEGVFITLDNNDGHVEENKGPAWKNWYNCYKKSDLYDNKKIFRNQVKRIELNPVFVWWHTLSHLLLRTLSIYSGYSSASIRERIYFERGKKGSRGGIILYTVQPGEGTMGGLVSLTNKFAKMIDKAYKLSVSCPNDPLCIENKFKKGDVSGAACYGCLLVSETSCEHRNMFLDRHILKEMRP